MGLNKTDFIKLHGEEAWLIEADKRRKYHEEYNKKHREEKKVYNQKYYAENLDAINAQKKKYQEKNKEAIKQYRKQYYEENKSQILEDRKKYRENNKEKVSLYNKKWRENNKEYIKEKQHTYYLENQEKAILYRKNNYDPLAQKEWWNKYNNTKKGKAKHHASHYKSDDLKRGYDASQNVDGKWIENHIFNSSCIYCGDTNWKHLGCDRVNNDLPHTSNNCICACGICNVERQCRKMSVEEFIEYRKTHPILLGIPKYEEIVMVNGLKVLRKKAV